LKKRIFGRNPNKPKTRPELNSTLEWQNIMFSLRGSKKKNNEKIDIDIYYRKKLLVWHDDPLSLEQKSKCIVYCAQFFPRLLAASLNFHDVVEILIDP